MSADTACLFSRSYRAGSCYFNLGNCSINEKIQCLASLTMCHKYVGTCCQ